MSRSPRRKRAVIDATLIERLDSLAGAAVARLPEAAYPLVNKLSAAKLVPPARLLEPFGAAKLGAGNRQLVSADTHPRAHALEIGCDGQHRFGRGFEQ